ncbi:MAG: lipoprotein-releasing system ATP-binding protein LolD [Bacteroidetes bacterium]|nr:MAG: lipoprotein-releasing system ATP-binding protein LolD [Bacteroidota bacterium]
MIKAVDIRKSFGELEVLKGINLEINKSEIVSITGPSGAGKTTLLQILGSLENPTSGKIFINNTELGKLNSTELAKYRNKHIGFVFQFHHLLPEFDALENVFIPALIAKKSKKEAEKNALEILNYMGLKDRIHHKPNELSGGEQQRVAIARALINKPDVIFADEPSGNLDVKRSDELHNLFFNLRDEFGQTYVIVTHNKELADRADSKIVIEDGVISLE